MPVRRAGDQSVRPAVTHTSRTGSHSAGAGAGDIRTAYHAVMASPHNSPAYRSPLLMRPGAVEAEGIDAGTAWHYGDPMAEQRAAETGAALFDRSNRSVLTVAGDDRLTWLHTLTTQFLSTLSEAQTTQALILSPQGHVQHHFVVTEWHGTAVLDTEPAAGVALLAFLDGMRFWSKVENAEVTGSLAVLTVAGPTAGTILARVFPEAGTGADAVPVAGGFARRTEDGFDLVVERALLPDTAAALIAAGATPAGSWAAAAQRIPTRRPRWGVDTDERTIPNEVSWLQSAVHLDKGCYCGQETVARVHNLGRPPRRLVMLNLDGSAGTMPETGDAVVTTGGKVVGRVGTVAQHYEDGPIALALVKRGLDVGTALLAGSIDAAIDPDDALGEADHTTPLSVIDRRALSQIRRN